MCRKYEKFQNQKELTTTAFDNASNKDLQLQEEMERINKNRKKMKEALAEERKKIIQYEKIPSESERVSKFLFSLVLILTKAFKYKSIILVDSRVSG